jgi:ribonuclease HI
MSVLHIVCDGSFDDKSGISGLGVVKIDSDGVAEINHGYSSKASTSTDAEREAIAVSLKVVKSMPIEQVNNYDEIVVHTDCAVVLSKLKKVASGINHVDYRGQEVRALNQDIQDTSKELGIPVRLEKVRSHVLDINASLIERAHNLADKLAGGARLQVESALKSPKKEKRGVIFLSEDDGHTKRDWERLVDACFSKGISLSVNSEIEEVPKDHPLIVAWNEKKHLHGESSPEFNIIEQSALPSHRGDIEAPFSRALLGWKHGTPYDSPTFKQQHAHRYTHVVFNGYKNYTATLNADPEEAITAPEFILLPSRDESGFARVAELYKSVNDIPLSNDIDAIIGGIKSELNISQNSLDSFRKKTMKASAYKVGSNIPRSSGVAAERSEKNSITSVPESPALVILDSIMNIMDEYGDSLTPGQMHQKMKALAHENGLGGQQSVNHALKIISEKSPMRRESCQAVLSRCTVLSNSKNRHDGHQKRHIKSSPSYLRRTR